MQDIFDFLLPDVPRFEPRSGHGFLPVIETGISPGAPGEFSRRRKLSNYEQVEVAAATAEVSAVMKGKLNITERDAQLARDLFTSQRKVSKFELANKPETLVKLRALMSEYDYEAVADAIWLKNYITNRLLIESDGKNARDRLIALEKLGKLTEVGAFTDKSELLIKHESTESLEASVRDTIDKMLGKPVEGQSEVLG